MFFAQSDSSGLASPDNQQTGDVDRENHPVSAAVESMDSQQTHDDTTTSHSYKLCGVYDCPNAADSGWSAAATNNVLHVRQHQRQCLPLGKYGLCAVHYHKFNQLQCQPPQTDPIKAVRLTCHACSARSIYSRKVCATHQTLTEGGGSVTLPCHLLGNLPLYDQLILEKPSTHLFFCGTCKEKPQNSNAAAADDQPNCKLCTAPSRRTCFQVSSLTTVDEKATPDDPIVHEHQVIRWNAEIRGSPLSLTDFICSLHRHLLSRVKRNTCGCWDCSKQPVKTRARLNHHYQLHVLTLGELRLLSQSPEPLHLPYGSVFQRSCVVKHGKLFQDGSVAASVHSDGDGDGQVLTSPSPTSTADEVPFRTPDSAEAAPSRRHPRRKLAYKPAPPPPMHHMQSSPLPGIPVDSPAFSEATSSQTTNTELDDIPSSPKRKQPRRARARSSHQANELAELNDIITRLAAFVDQPPVLAKHRLQQDFDGRAPGTQRRFLALYNKMIDCAAKAINPASPAQLQEAAARQGRPRETLCEFARRRMDDLVMLYDTADEKQMKRSILAIACVRHQDGKTWEDTKMQLAAKFSCTPHEVSEARRTRRLNDMGKYYTNQTIVRDRLDLSKVQDFISWAFESCQFSLMPYGVMTLKLESGEQIRLGKVVQSGLSGHIIDSYLASKAGSEYEPLSKRALYRILNVIIKLKPTRALSGLDYYAVQGQEALQTMEALLQSHVKEKDMKSRMANELNKIRRYLMTKYASEVSARSPCATHCPAFALSHPAKAELKQTCEHEHTDCCPDCALIRSTTSALHDCLTAIVDGKERERALWSYSEALNDLVDWQRHQLRCSQQRKGRLEIINAMKQDEALLIFDYGNKILPRKYRESVREYFGKKGMSILTFALIMPGAPDSQQLLRRTYTILMQESDQLVSDVLGLYDLVLCRIRRDHPLLRTLHEKTDNASNFKNALLLSCRPTIAAKHNFKIGSVLFCEPGDGKDMPDAHFGQLRQLLDARLDAGHDQMTAEQLFDVLNKAPTKIKGANYAVATITHRKSQKSEAAVGIKAYHHFRYEDGGQIRGWHNFGIGSGELLSLKVSDRRVEDMLPKVTVKAGYDFADGVAPSVSTTRARKPQASAQAVVGSAAGKVKSSDAVRHLFVDSLMSSVDREQRDHGPPPPLEAADSARTAAKIRF